MDAVGKAPHIVFGLRCELDAFPREAIRAIEMGPERVGCV